MAFTAREVLMVFRGQNYLSSTIRKVGRDVSSLSRGQQLQMQRAQLQIVGQRLAQSRQIAATELTSVQSGARRLANERAIAEQKVTQMRNDATLLRNQAQLSRATRAVAAGRPLRGFNMDETIMQQKSLQSSVAAATASIENQEISIQQLAAREVQLAEREAQLTQIINTRTRAMELNTLKLEQNALAARNLPIEQWRDYARTIEHAGRVMQMFGLIATAAIGIAASQAAKFNTSVTLAATQSTVAGHNTTRQVVQNAAVIQKQIQAMLIKGQTAASTSDLTGGIYTIFSGLTLKGNQRQQLQQGLSILQQFNRVFTANYGQVAFNDVVKAGIALINNFGISATRLPQVLNRMQASVRFGAMSMGDFVGSLNQVVPAFRGAHYSFDQLAADVAFVSRLFPSLRTGTTGLARLTETFARYHTQFSQAVGVNIAPGGKLSPVATIVQEIIKARPQLAKGGVDLQNFFKQVTGATGTIQARRVFIGYATQLGLYHKVAGSVLHDNNELNKSFTDMSQTPQVRWEEFKNQLRGIVLEIGAGAIPAFHRMGKVIEPVIHWFERLSPHTKRLIGDFTAFAAIGSLLGGTLLAVVGGLASLVLSYTLLTRGGGGLSALVRGSNEAKLGLAGMSSEAGFISGRMLLGLGIPAVLFLLVKYHHQVGEIVGRLGGFKGVLIAVAAGLAAFRATQFLTAMGLIGSAAVATAGEVGILEGALLALGGPEVLAALAATAAALALYAGLTAKNNSGIRATNPQGTVLRHTRTGYSNIENFSPHGGFSTPTHITAAEARKRFGTQGLTPQDQRNFRDRSRVAGGDSSTDQHASAMRNLVAQTNNYAKALAKAAAERARLNAAERRRNALDKSAGVGTGLSLTASANQWITKVEAARKRMLGSPNDLQAAQAYETVVANLNKRFKDQPNLLAAINDILGNYDSNVKKAINGTKTLGVTFQDVLSKVQSMYQDFKSQETSIFGTLFSGPFVNSPFTQNNLQFGGQLSGQDLMRDLRSQITQFKDFHGQLNQLSQRGAPFALVQQIQQLGPDAVMGKIDRFGRRSPSLMQKILGLSPQQQREYFATFKQSQKLIADQSMRDLNAQLSQYRKYGRNIALAIVAGLRDENVGLTKALTKMVHNMFPGLPTGATGAGGKPTHHPIVHHHHHDHTSIHVVAPKKDHATIKAQVRHADLTRRNRHQGRGGVPR